MELAELTTLLTPEGLRLVDELGAIDSTDGVAAAVSRLRASGLSPDLVSAAVGQARLRTRARAKFGEFADRMLFTRAGLEQATRLEVGARHAGRFRDAGIRRVADLGCGIGGDSLAFAGIGLEVLAVEADEVTAALAAYNLAPFGDGAHVQHARAEEVDLAGVDGVWLDPARRTAGHTETTRVGAGDWSPPLEWVWSLAARTPAGIKLGPAFDRALIPADAEAQWISVDGSTIELVVWTGILARPDVRRAALVIRGGVAAELVASGDAADAPVRDLGAYLHEPEGAVIRARLIGEVARTMDAGMIDAKIAYLTSDAAVDSPFVQSFRVRERMPNDVKALARALRERGIGTLEIKKRGVDIDPAALRTKLKLRGAEAATLFVTRIGDARVTLLADRV
ncbi:MAG: SAM-dependent methyltransferase [Microbacterium sp. SCN 70-200]|uniref:class I SAM-dependent methyltransferase n=1 Tax=unclassified Microbacterium TaxID=2609290 RepID=UPI00086A2ED6|nr:MULTISPECIES: class I SAM-dependent methyltransferase [unclassified Microbacterium]MBN9215739.1 class I SAM-dependent methyltransferase [Microbacterium sp.]ODT39973.1 MAG: SAM-dependent methyltransferase [Microbacterium sp. SCN 70-200]OJV81998.1 MAG: SAM-dependent methyltransferase [Microbacterium sp. 70-16]